MKRTVELKKCTHHANTTVACSGNGTGAHSTSQAKEPCGLCENHCLLRRLHGQYPKCAHTLNFLKLKWINETTLKTTSDGLAALGVKKESKNASNVSKKRGREAQSDDAPRFQVNVYVNEPAVKVQKLDNSSVASSSGSTANITVANSSAVPIVSVTASNPSTIVSSNSTSAAPTVAPPARDSIVAPTQPFAPTQHSTTASSVSSSNSVLSQTPALPMIDAKEFRARIFELFVSETPMSDSVRGCIADVHRGLRAFEFLAECIISPSSKDSEAKKQLKNQTFMAVLDRFNQARELGKSIAENHPSDNKAQMLVDFRRERKAWDECIPEKYIQKM